MKRLDLPSHMDISVRRARHMQMRCRMGRGVVTFANPFFSRFCSSCFDMRGYFRGYVSLYNV